MSTVIRGRAAVAVAALLVLGLLAFGSTSANAAKSKRIVNATTTLKALVNQTRALPPAAAQTARKARLLRTARHAANVARGNPCSAVKDLASYRKTLRITTIRRTVRGAKLKAALRRRLATLGSSSTRASTKLLSDRRTTRCGGGVIPSTLGATKTSVLSSDENGLSLRVQLPKLSFSPQTGGGKTWTQITLPDTDATSGAGKPSIPVVSSTYGVPDGATVAVVPGATESYTIGGVDLYPHQPESFDAVPPPPNVPDPNNPLKPNFLANQFATPPFTIDRNAYDDKDLFPAKPASGEILGQARDITIGGLQIPAAQYNAAAQTLKVINSVDVRITFTGGAKTFSEELGSPWERSQRTLIASLLNINIIRSRLPFVIRRCGEEMLVITNPATQAAADQFATAKRAQGWRTNVFQVGSAAGQIGTTPAQIQAFIRSHLSAPLCIHPSYVTIMGDDDLVATNAGIDGIPSDLPYSMKNDADELPDVAVGRILGNDATEVGNAVAKIIGYETTAPTANGMLNKATIAAQFQDDDNDGQENRTFVWFAETVRRGLLPRGVSVDRIYGESPGNNPQRFVDGTSLPAALKKPTFGWNGTGAQVSAAWNQGRFLMVHRDHGWSDGWGLPGYGTGDVNALTNGALLPVLLSINCSSGAYDYDETSFASQALVKSGGGAVGVFGDTRDSPSWHNSQIALGFVDALLPSVLPSEGPTSKQRTGDALINGKLRLAGLAPPSGDGSTRDELYLWHYFGDPSMQMWGGGSAPVVFNPALITAIYKPGPITIPDPPPYEVLVGSLPAQLAGQPISLLRNGQVIGKAIVNGDGTAEIPASFGDGSVRPGELEVAAEGDGAQPFKIAVTGVPEPTPPPPPPPAPAAPTTLTQTCPATADLNPQTATGTISVSGTLSAAPAGSTVVVTFIGPAPPSGTSTGPVTTRTAVVNATTDASGAWTAAIPVAAPADLGTWSVSSSYAGSADFASSQGGPCSILVRLPPVIG